MVLHKKPALTGVAQTLLYQNPVVPETQQILKRVAHPSKKVKKYVGGNPNTLVNTLCWPFK